MDESPPGQVPQQGWLGKCPTYVHVTNNKHPPTNESLSTVSNPPTSTERPQKTALLEKQRPIDLHPKLTWDVYLFILIISKLITSCVSDCGVAMATLSRLYQTESWYRRLLHIVVWRLHRYNRRELNCFVSFCLKGTMFNSPFWPTVCVVWTLQVTPRFLY